LGGAPHFGVMEGWWVELVGRRRRLCIFRRWIVDRRLWLIWLLRRVRWRRRILVRRRRQLVTAPQITSSANPRVKAWLALAKRSVRDSTGMFLVEGLRETKRLASFVDAVETIWCADYSDGIEPLGATTVSKHVFDRISRRQHPDGIALVATAPDLGISQFEPGPVPIVLVADGIEKPGNIGAMIRTCDALGAAFLGSGLKTDLVNPNVIRAAQGSLFATPLASASRNEAIKWCTANTSVFTAMPKARVSMWKGDYTGPVSIVVGAEDEGIAAEWSDAGAGVFIPMSGKADSMNASVSAAILIAEVVRQRSVSTAG
jgi:TrmH family RNA methyltransferase